MAGTGNSEPLLTTDHKNIDSFGEERRRARFTKMTPSLTRIQAALAQIDPDWVDFGKRQIDEDLWVKLQRDAVIAKAVKVLIHRVSSDWYLRAQDRESRVLVPYFRRLIEQIPQFANSRANLSKAIFEGRGALKILGTEKRMTLGEDREERKWWHVGRLMHIGADALRMEYHTRQEVDAEGNHKTVEDWHYKTYDPMPTRRQWYIVEHPEHYCIFIHGDDWNSFGGGNGLIDSLAVYHEMKTKLMRRLYQGIRRFAYPFMIVQLEELDEAGSEVDDFEANDERAKAIATALEKMAGGSNVLTIGSKDKVTPVDFNGQSAQAMLSLIQYIDEAMVGVILAATMPTGGGEAGSLARAQVEQDSTDDLIRFYRQNLEEALQAIIWNLWVQNRENWQKLGFWGTGLQPPKLCVGRERSDDPQYMLQIYQGAHNLGMTLKSSEVAEALGIEEADDEDIETGGALPPPGMAPPAPEQAMNPATGMPLDADGVGPEMEQQPWP